MKRISFEELRAAMTEILRDLGMKKENAGIVADVYIHMTKRGTGHHDINDFMSHAEEVRKGRVNANPKFTRLAEFNTMESWDGDCGMGELTADFIMKRAVALAGEYGMGMCTIRNSNHYLASSPYVEMAARAGCVGIIIAKDAPSMGVPGFEGKLIGQSPNGFAFPTGKEWPVMMDGCLAYVSGHGKLHQYAEAGREVPDWWGVDSEGLPTTDPEKLLKGTRYPIGEHKGFGYAMLCEMLTGVMGRGPILDQEPDGTELRNTTVHTAIAIKTDGLMGAEEFRARSTELVDRLEDRAPGLRIPGKRSYEAKAEYEKTDILEISDEAAAYLGINTARPEG